MREELETRVRALGLQDVVTFTGPLAPPQVAEEFKKADSVVLASFGEGIPVVLMEAFSHGRPVIATYVGGIPELVQNGKNGYLVPPGSAPELTGAITRLLADPEAAREMGRKGRETIVSRYREDTGAARLAKLFRGEPLE
jgi:glycosyltransferase involved in cell wall biosynthesis